MSGRSDLLEITNARNREGLGVLWQDPPRRAGTVYRPHPCPEIPLQADARPECGCSETTVI